MLVELDPTKKYILLLDRAEFEPSVAQQLMQTIMKAKTGDVVAALVAEPNSSLRFVEVDEKVCILQNDDQQGQAEAREVENTVGSGDADQSSPNQG